MSKTADSAGYDVMSRREPVCRGEAPPRRLRTVGNDRMGLIAVDASPAAAYNQVVTHDSAAVSGAHEDVSETKQSASAQTLEALAAAATRGDRGAEERLFELASPKLLAMALALGVRADDAGDLVQDVLITAWRNLDRFDAARGSFLGWLAPGVRGRIKNGWRGRRRESHFLRRFLQAGGMLRSSDDARPQAAVEARMTVERLVGALSPRQREVVALYELAGLDSEETARVLGIGAAGVRSIARDARRRLEQESRRSSTQHGSASGPRRKKADGTP